MTLIKLFWIFVAIYAVVKACFFVGVYFVSKAVERRAFAEQEEKARTAARLNELESMVALYERRLKVAGKEDQKRSSWRRFAS
ncbi:MAG: hypothetical protein QHH02_08145 [Syntrophomonadaceae bacterium]|jgi:hypothetical protein|nr:hypothetical protein [Syntrophomonadaceae bacterium]